LRDTSYGGAQEKRKEWMAPILSGEEGIAITKEQGDTPSKPVTAGSI